MYIHCLSITDIYTTVRTDNFRDKAATSSYRMLIPAPPPPPPLAITITLRLTTSQTLRSTFSPHPTIFPPILKAAHISGPPYQPFPPFSHPLSELFNPSHHPLTLSHHFLTHSKGFSYHSHHLLTLSTTFSTTSKASHPTHDLLTVSHLFFLFHFQGFLTPLPP